MRNALRPAVGFFANVTVVTALLVYFGWRRAETQAHHMGIDESLLGMSTQEYLLRSVGPVLVLLIGVSVAGLLWTSAERRLTPVLRNAVAPPVGEEDRPPRDRAALLGLRALGSAWLLLPVVVVLVGYIWPAPAFVLFPASLGVGILLWLYAGKVRRGAAAAPDEALPGHETAVLVCAALLVLVCVFWTASNYAEVLGQQLADDFAAHLADLPGVTAYGEHRLHLDGPGVVESEVGAADETLRFRYTGLRLLEHTGGRYFLVSDGWTDTYGVVFVLQDDDPSIRLDFVRDRRPHANGLPSVSVPRR